MESTGLYNRRSLFFLLIDRISTDSLDILTTVRRHFKLLSQLSLVAPPPVGKLRISFLENIEPQSLFLCHILKIPQFLTLDSFIYVTLKKKTPKNLCLFKKIK